jgi:hypothetical protein
MPLYLVCTNSAGDGENMDLFVYADNPRAAIKLHNKYYEMDRDEFERPYRVMTVPAQPKRFGAIDWGKVEWVKIV